MSRPSDCVVCCCRVCTATIESFACVVCRMQELALHGLDIVFRRVPQGEEVEQRVLPRDAIVPAARVAFDATETFDTVRVTFGEERVEEDASFSEHDIEGGSVLKVEVWLRKCYLQ